MPGRDPRRGPGGQRLGDERRWAEHVPPQDLGDLGPGAWERFNSDEARYGPGSHGRRYEPAQPWRGGGYDREPESRGGQEYGVEGGHQWGEPAREPESQGRGDERETWRGGAGEPYGDLELNPRNRGVQEFGPPSDYAYHPHAGHEFDTDYLRWREEQMLAHDRAYEAWRRAQEQRYDEEYRRYRIAGRGRAGFTFEDWLRADGAAPPSFGPPERAR